MLDKYKDFEQFSFKNIIQKLRENTDDDVYLRVHMINNFTFEDDNGYTEADLMMQERELEENQQYKRNSYLKLLTQFSNRHPVPT